MSPVGVGGSILIKDANTWETSLLFYLLFKKKSTLTVFVLIVVCFALKIMLHICDSTPLNEADLSNNHCILNHVNRCGQVLSNYIHFCEVHSSVARAFPGGRLAHLESQNEEENEQNLRKNNKNWSNFEEKWGKWKSYPCKIVALEVHHLLLFVYWLSAVIVDASGFENNWLKVKVRATILVMHTVTNQHVAHHASASHTAVWWSKLHLSNQHCCQVVYLCMIWLQNLGNEFALATLQTFWRECMTLKGNGGSYFSFGWFTKGHRIRTSIVKAN